MGKIKGWKKIKGSKLYPIVYSKNNTYGMNLKEIGVAYQDDGDYWEVDFFGIQGYTYKIFKTKKEALEYARKYMRSHPNG